MLRRVVVKQQRVAMTEAPKGLVVPSKVEEDCIGG